MTLLFKPLFVCALAIGLIGTKPSAGASEVGWNDLIDTSAQNFEDPYRDLTSAQMDALRTILIARQSLASGGLTEADRHLVEQDLAQAEGVLSADGIDPDWLISQRWVVAERREWAAKAGNPDVDGASITLAGFAIAAPPDVDGKAIVYLVPERGMCSHMPPPNPNQMIRVRLSEDWRPSYVHEPVRLTGTVSIVPTQEKFHIVDGPVQMNATFLMEAEKVETFTEMRAQSDPLAANDWAKQLANRLRETNQAHSAPKVDKN